MARPFWNAARRAAIGPGLAALLVVAPVLVAGLLPFATGERRAPQGDQAGLEIYTREALDLRQLVGPYSRYPFHHPGPAFFYLAAPLYRASDGRYAGIDATAALLAAAAMLAMLYWAFAGGGPAAAWATALALALAVGARGASAWASAWNPNVAAAAFGACLFGFARVAAGGAAALPWAVAFGSLAVQCHLSCAPAVAAAALVAVGAALRQGGLGRRAWLASAAVAAAFWALPVRDALGPGAGNLGDLWAFFSRAHAAHGVVESALAVARAFAFMAPAGVAPLVALLLLGASAWAFRRARERAAAGSAWLALFALVGVPLATLATTRASGFLYGYLLRWVVLLGVAALASVGHLLLLAAAERAPTGAWVPAAGLSAIAVLGLVGAWPGIAAAEDRGASDSEQVLRLADALAVRLEERGIHRPLVVATDPLARPVALGVLLELEKLGVSFAVKPFNVIRFPPGWAPGREDAAIAFEHGRRHADRSGLTLVHEGPYRVELLPRVDAAQP